MQSLKIRKIIPTDNPYLSNIIKSVLKELQCNLKGTAYYDKETDAMYEAYQNEKTVYFVAELNSKIVGGCGIGTLENNICELQKMYISPNGRGKKIGYSLLKKCIGFAIENNYDSIYLETFPQMKVAISLYRKNGFYAISKAMGNTCHYACNVWMLKPLKRNLLQIKKDFYNELKNVYPKEEINFFFSLLAEEHLQMNRVSIALNPKKEVDIDTISKFYLALNKLKKQIPIQYILGKTTFYQNPFIVNENVLIPRPETEELVNWIITDFKNTSTKLEILDIGTGSGCIAISLAKELQSSVTSLDISKLALQIVKENAKLNNVSVTLMEKDILKNINFTLKYKLDIIVSNPPYVREMEKKQMQKNVLNNEPHLALFVKNENPLLFYDAIADFAKINLKPNGKLYFEINEFLGKETVKLLQQKGFNNVILKKDIYGKDRMISCVL